MSTQALSGTQAAGALLSGPEGSPEPAVGLLEWWVAASAAVSQGTLTVLPYQLMPLRTRGAPFAQSEPSQLANSSSEGAAATPVGIRPASEQVDVLKRQL